MHTHTYTPTRTPCPFTYSPAHSLPPAHFPLILLLSSPGSLPGWLLPPSSCVSPSADTPNLLKASSLIALICLLCPCICLPPVPGLLTLPFCPLPREVAAASYAMTVWSQPPGRAGGFCTLAVSPTTMRGCLPRGALATSWCPLSTPDTQPLCQTSPAIVPSYAPLLGGGLSGSSSTECMFGVSGTGCLTSFPNPQHTALSRISWNPLVPSFSPQEFMGESFWGSPCDNLLFLSLTPNKGGFVIFESIYYLSSTY